MTLAVTEEVLGRASEAAARLGLTTTEFCEEAIARAAGQILRQRITKEAENSFWDSVSPEEKDAYMRVLDSGLADLERERW